MLPTTALTKKANALPFVQAHAARIWIARDTNSDLASLAPQSFQL